MYHRAGSRERERERGQHHLPGGINVRRKRFFKIELVEDEVELIGR